MSHITSYNTKLKLGSGLPEGSSLADDPGFDILREAVEAVAADHGGQVTDAIRDYYGRKVKCDLGLITPEFPRGIGVRVNRQTGEVNFIYDSYGGYDMVIHGLSEEIQQAYVSIAVSRAMKTLNYEVEVTETRASGREKQVLVRGVL